MTQLDRHTRTAGEPLASLAARLTSAQDRETYAALISYFQSLPPGDELFRLAQLLGFLSLLGQRLPEAVRELLEALREQTMLTTEYHTKLDERLADLPQSIAEGVNVDAIAEGMGEKFRQQLASTGLQDTAALLNRSLSEIKTLSGQFAAVLQPVTGQFKGIGSTISTQLGRLTAASRELQQHNAGLITQEREQSLLRKGLLGLALFLIGGVCGILLEKRQTTDLISDINAHIQKVQEQATPRASLEKNTK